MGFDNFGPRLGQNYPFGPREEFYEIPLKRFYVFFVPHLAAKFEKSP